MSTEDAPGEVRVGEGLGAAPGARSMTLADVKKGDAVALYRRGGGVLQRWQVERCAATRITVDDKQYTRKGYAVGAARDGRGPDEWIEVWDEKKHPVEIDRQRALRRLTAAQHKLRSFPWAAVTQEQANAVLATMQSLGMLEAPNV